MSQPQPRETYFDNLLYVVIPNENFKLVQFNNIPPMFLLTYLKIIKLICLFVISLIYSKNYDFPLSVCLNETLPYYREL